MRDHKIINSKSKSVVRKAVSAMPVAADAFSSRIAAPMRLCLTFLVGLLSLSASSVSACETFEDTWINVDHYVEYLPDGSFANAGAPPHRDGISGLPVVVLGEGKFAQRIVDAGGCFAFAYLLFVDCGSEEGIMLWNDEIVRDYTSLRVYSGIESIQPPNGPIAISSSQTVSELFATAELADIAHVDARQAFASLEHWNRPDLFVACQSIYPEISENTQ